MSTKVTELIARITADASQLKREFETIKAGARDVAKTGKDASTATGDGLGHIGREAKKAGNEISGVLGAIGELRTKGVAGIGDVIKEGAGLAGLFGPTGLIVGGIAVAAVAIVGLFTKAAAEAKEARKKIQEEMSGLINTGSVDAITEKLRILEQGTPGANFEDGIRAQKARIAILEHEQNAMRGTVAEYSRRGKAIDEEKRKLHELEQQWKDLLVARNQAVDGLNRQAGRSNPNAPTINVKSDTAARDAKALKELRDASDALTNAFSKQDRTVESIALRIDAWKLSAIKAKIPTQEITNRVNAMTDAMEEFAKTDGDASLAKSVAAIEKLNDVITKQLNLRIGIKSAQSDEEQAYDRAKKDLEDEITALRAGTEAYELYQRAKQGETAVIEAQQRAFKEGRTLSSQEIIDIRTKALALFDLQQGAQQALAALSSNDAGKAATALAAVADQATRIATSLGKGGEGLAKMAGLAGVLATSVAGIQQALVKIDPKTGNVVKDSKGNNQTVSFFDSLRGSNGKDSQAKSVSSSISIVGAIVAVANVFDLFGNKARAKAKALRDAAKEFNDAIASFATETSRIGEQGVRAQISSIRDQLSTAVNAALKAAGFDELSATDASGRATQQQVDAFRARALTLLRSKDSTEFEEGSRLARFTEALQVVVDQVAARLKAIAPQVLSALDAEFNDAIGNSTLNEIAQATQHYNNTLEDLQQLLKYGAISQEQYNESVTKAGVVFDHAKEIIADAIKTAERAKVLDKLSSDNDILGGSAQQKLSRTLGALAPLFKELNGLDGAKLGGADGLKALQARLVGIFEALSADGISDEEQPIVAAIKQILGLITDALNELPDPFQNALDAFTEQVSVFGLSFAEQFAGLRKIFGSKFAELLGDAFDPSASGGLEGVKAKLQERIHAILDDAVISEDESPLLAALKQLLASVDGMLDDAAAAAEASARDAEAAVQRAADARRQRLGDANTRIAIDDLTGTAAIRERLRGVSDQFAELFAAFDLDALNGVTGAKEALKALLQQIEPLSDDEVFAQFRLTREEIIAAMLDLDGSLDSLAGTLGDTAKAALDAANAQREFVDSLDDKYLRATGRSQEADIKAAERDRDASLQRALDLGLGDATTSKIKALFDADIQRINAQYAEEVANAAQEASNNRNSSSVTPIASSSRSFAGPVDTSTLAVLSVLRQIEQAARTTAANTTTLPALLAGIRGPSAIQVPQIPSYLMPRFAGASNSDTSAVAGGVVMQFTINVILPQGSVVIGNASDIGNAVGAALKQDQTLVRAMDSAMQQLAGNKRRNQGLQ